MTGGLYYYKLVSPYSNDVSKQCKLSVTEIDHNFVTLKDADIDKAELDEKSKSVILTRNDGDKLVVDLSPVLSGTVYDLEVNYDENSGSCDGSSLRVTYSILDENDNKQTVTVPINGLVTVDNIGEIVRNGLLPGVVTDGTLVGKGTLSSPLGIKSTEKDTPAEEVIDVTNGQTLPEVTAKGTRYVTKEYVSEFGYLYNYYAVEKINKQLKEEGRGWRVPTKADWDCLLNSIEPCEYRDHDSAMCHQILGKYAGTKLKSECGWLNQPECECKATKPLPGQQCLTGDTDSDDDDEIFADDEPNTIKPSYWGTDNYGMRILPTGYGDGKEITHYFNKSTVFWTTTHVYNDLSQDIYVKEFDWDKSGVVQEAQCPDALFSLRLVKDYNGENHNESEIIDGDTYETLLFPDCGAIWTSSNFASKKEAYGPVEANMGLNPYNRVVYYINDWNGTEWDKRALKEGETVVIKDGNERCQHNIEYRVYTEDGCNQILVNADDTVVQRVLDVVTPLIEEEADAREAADNELREMIEAEISARTEADATEKAEREEMDGILQEMIEEESVRAQTVEQQLWEGLDNEREAREQVDTELWEALNNETSARTDVDNQIWNALNGEISARTDVDNQIWSALTAEATAREDVDNQLWQGLAEEYSARTDVDNQIWSALTAEAEARETNVRDLWEGIAKEASARTDVDMQLWDALNQEIEDRIAADEAEKERAEAEEKRIEGMIIDNPENPENEKTLELGEDGYVMHVSDGMTLFSKADTNNIAIKFDADFGTF